MPPFIRPAEPTDYEALREMMAQPKVVAGTLQLPFPSAEMWRQRIAEYPAGDHLLVALVKGRVVGHVGIHAAGKSIRRRHAAMIGMGVHDEYHGQGVGSALLAAALDLADNWMQISRVELTVFVDNTAAIALYRKFGFEIEGTHRQYAFRAGDWADTYSMARLRPMAAAARDQIHPNKEV